MALPNSFPISLQGPRNVQIDCYKQCVWLLFQVKYGQNVIFFVSESHFLTAHCCLPGTCLMKLESLMLSWISEHPYTYVKLLNSYMMINVYNEWSAQLNFHENLHTKQKWKKKWSRDGIGLKPVPSYHWCVKETYRWFQVQNSRAATGICYALKKILPAFHLTFLGSQVLQKFCLICAMNLSKCPLGNVRR